MQAAGIDELPAFINTYSKDTRQGVALLVKKAEKMLEAYEKELDRTEKMKEFEKSTVHFPVSAALTK